MNYDDLYKAFQEAALKAIEATGDAYKNMSWFGRNKKADTLDEKKAA